MPFWGHGWFATWAANPSDWILFSGRTVGTSHQRTLVWKQYGLSNWLKWYSFCHTLVCLFLSEGRNGPVTNCAPVTFIPTLVHPLWLSSKLAFLFSDRANHSFAIHLLNQIQFFPILILQSPGNSVFVYVSLKHHLFSDSFINAMTTYIVSSKSVEVERLLLRGQVDGWWDELNLRIS